MSNLTIVVEEELLRRARVRATEEGTTVNALLRGYLERYAGAAEECRLATDSILRMAAESRSTGGEKRWTREDLHDRDGLR